MSAPNVDLLLGIHALRSKAAKWRVLAVSLFFLLIAFFTLSEYGPKSVKKGSAIARVTINGIITENDYRDSLLRTLRNNKNYSAVIVYVNSPGGSVVGSEILYSDIKYIAEKKPVVALMGSIAASGGYLVSLASERIFAHEGTLTGSIGAIAQSVEFTDLLSKLGITPIVIKKPALKSMMSPMEKMTKKNEGVVEGLLTDTYNFFLELIEHNRKITREELLSIADGRVYTARQALQYNLIDQIGNEDDVLQWLKSNKAIHDDVVKDFDIRNHKTLLSSAPFMKNLSHFFNNKHFGLQMIANY